MGAPRPNEFRNTRYLIGDEGVNGPGQYFNTTTLSTRFLYSRVWSGVRTPGFKTLKKSQYPVNNHSVRIREVFSNKLVEHGYDNITYKDANPPWVQYNSHVGALTDRYVSPSVELTHMSTSENEALSNLIKAAQAGISGNIAQSISEAGKTISMIATAASAIAKAGIALKNGNIPGAVSALARSSDQSRYQKRGAPSVSKSVANNWLALQYGWKPFLHDIEGALQSLGKHAQDSAMGPSALHSVTGSASSSRTTESKYAAANYPSQFPQAGYVITMTDTRVKFGIRYRVTDPVAAFLQQTGFTNPVNLAWELLPFSFVADWFLPIGPALEMLSYSHGLTFDSGYKLRFSKSRTISSLGYGGAVAGSNVVVMGSGDYTEEQVLLDREVLSEFPSPTWPSPRMGINDSKSGVSRAANAIALVTQVFKS
jgi:hypothetical protein